MNLYSVKMRASRAGEHVSGAEKIVEASAAAATAARLVERALNHEKGTPDFVNVKLSAPGEIIRLKALAVTNNVVASAAEGRELAIELLERDGIAHAREIMELLPQTHSMRGAMLIDADTLERLDGDGERGVRATCMDDAESSVKGTASGKNHYAEAMVLATKVQNAPGIIGEICVSDDPAYVTGYVASPHLGYQRISAIKEKGDSNGGRIFIYRGRREDVSAAVEFLERQSVIVEDVPVLDSPLPERRFSGIAAELTAIERAGLMRECRVLDKASRSLRRGGVLILSANDYLSLADDPRVIEAGVAALRRDGAGSGGSRLTTGTYPVHRNLEAHLARFKGCEEAIVFATGYMANVGTIQALAGKGDAILSDALNHASIIDGCRLSGAEVVVYRHGDLSDLARKLSLCREYRRRLVVSDAVFSMDGDILDLPRWLEICRRYDAFSMIDEAHSTGVLGTCGRGLAEHFACGHPDITLGTLSKALGSEGAFVCGSRDLIRYLRNKARSFIFSTAPSPAAMAAADAALSVLESDPSRVDKLRRNAAFFVEELRRRGVVVETATPIVPVPVGDEHRALAASQALWGRGILVPAIRYPTVARGAARLRCAVCAGHDVEELAFAAQAIAEVLQTV